MQMHLGMHALSPLGALGPPMHDICYSRSYLIVSVVQSPKLLFALMQDGMYEKGAAPPAEVAPAPQGVAAY